MIETQNNFRDSKKFTSICPWWWIKSPRSGGIRYEVGSALIGCMILDSGVRDVFKRQYGFRVMVESCRRFKRGREFGMGTLIAFSCSCHWIHIMILTKVKFWPLYMFCETFLLNMDMYDMYELGFLFVKHGNVLYVWAGNFFCLSVFCPGLPIQDKANLIFFQDFSLSRVGNPGQRTEIRKGEVALYGVANRKQRKN